MEHGHGLPIGKDTDAKESSVIAARCGRLPSSSWARRQRTWSRAVEEAPAGGSTIIPFVVPHGCDGSPTRSRVDPDAAGVTSAKPRSKPDGSSPSSGKLPKPVKDFAGNTVRRGVLEVTWSGGNLPDWQYEHVRHPARDAQRAGQDGVFPGGSAVYKGSGPLDPDPEAGTGRAGAPGAGSEAREVER